MVEQVYTRDLKSLGLGHASSTLASGTKQQEKKKMKYYYELTTINGNTCYIYDPNKNYICSVYSKHEAERLLSHLNKQNFIDPYLQTR